MKMRLPLIAAVISCLLTLPAAAQITPGTVTEGGAAWPATYPSWWYNAEDPANGVINATLPTFNQNNFAPLNQGQLWNLAAQAIQELDSQLATIGGANFSLADFSNGASPNYHAPANIGQLKHVSSHFFDRFAQVGFTPESPGWPATLILNTGPEDQAPNYPWLQNVTPSNAHIANLGQAKQLFSWDLSNWAPSNLDSDSDGLPDFWELAHGLNPHDFEDANLDLDGDGILNKFEWQSGTDPSSDQFVTDPHIIENINQFTYTNLGKLKVVSGSTNMTFTFDEEDNLVSAK